MRVVSEEPRHEALNFQRDRSKGRRLLESRPRESEEFISDHA